MFGSGVLRHFLCRHAPPPTDAPSLIEVGATVREGTLQLWLAQEALRNAELRLAAQAATLQSLEGRAASLMQWSVSAILGLLALAATRGDLIVPAVLGALAMAAAWACAACAVWPASWCVVGHEPEEILGTGLGSQLEELKAGACGYAGGIAENSRRLDAAGSWLRRASVCFAAAPVLGFLALRF